MTATDPDDSSPVGFNPEGSDPIEAVREYAERHAVIELLDPTFESFEDGVLTATVPYNAEFANPGTDGSYHGGMLVTMLDTVMGFAISCALADDESKLSGPTMTLTTNFHDTSTEGFELVGEVVRIGSASAFLNGEIRCAESNNLLTSAKGHWRVYER
jgi:uncharacterized protein (TIGR00369 family)